MKSIKGPAIFLAQFADDAPPSDWCAGLFIATLGYLIDF